MDNFENENALSTEKITSSTNFYDSYQSNWKNLEKQKSGYLWNNTKPTTKVSFASVKSTILDDKQSYITANGYSSAKSKEKISYKSNQSKSSTTSADVCYPETSLTITEDSGWGISRSTLNNSGVPSFCMDITKDAPNTGNVYNTTLTPDPDISFNNSNYTHAEIRELVQRTVSILTHPNYAPNTLPSNEMSNFYKSIQATIWKWTNNTNVSTSYSWTASNGSTYNANNIKTWVLNGTLSPANVFWLVPTNSHKQPEVLLNQTSKPAPVITNVTICSDETYQWSVNGVTYNGSAGNTTITVEGDSSVDGNGAATCAADQTLNITVSPEPTPIVTDITICSDEDYVWAFNSVTYNGSAGTQTVFVEGANCAADQTLNITVNPEPTPVVTDVTICSDEEYVWAFNSVTYNGSAGTQTVFVEGANCVADQTLNITVTPEPTPIVTDVTICSDEDYTWAFNSETYNGSAGTQTVFVEGVNCAADQTLNITVTPEPTPIVTDVTICSDEDYTWAFNSVTYNGSAGTQTVFVEGANCAADQTLNITVSPEPTPIVTDVTICSDEDYTWAFNSVTYNGSAGTQTVFVEGANCAADQTLNITVTPEPTPIVTDVTICSDEDYTWAFNSVTYNGSAGTQTVFVEGANCAADQTLNITVSPEPTPIVTDVTICSDEDYTWAFNSVTYNGSAGTQTVFVEGVNCAADQTLNITVTPEPTPIVTDVTICSDEEYVWAFNSVTYNGSAGTQTVFVEGVNCAADQTLNITVSPEPTPVVTDVTICSDEDYVWAFNSVTYNGSAGTQTVFVEGVNCAADQTLNITVSPEPTPIVTDVTICSDEDYTWAFNSITYNGSAGTQTVFVEGVNCAADQTLNITVSPEPTPIVTDVTICSDEEYTWAFNSITYNGSAGTQTVFVEGVNCAADQTLNITVSPEPTPIVTDVTICSDEDYTWAFNSVTYNGSAGTQTVFVEGVNCAADQILNITVNPEPTPIVTDVTICSDEDYVWAFNSVTYNGSAGTQTVFVEGVNCAADQTLNITVSPEPTPIVTDVTICSDEDYVWAFNSVTYNGSAGTQTVFVEGVNCAADQILNITVNPEPTPIVTDVTICSDEDYVWAFNSVTYNGSAGTQTVFVEGANCAADQTLNITVSPEPTPIVTDVTICSDEDYVWAFNSVTYNGSAGTQTVFVEGANCAADQTLNITVTPEPTPIVTDVTICSDEDYTWAFNSVTYNGSAGTQTVFVEGVNCAADQTLNITVSPEPTPIVTDVTICSDEDYVWAFNSVTYNGSAGTQTVFVEGVNCAADQTLNITVTPEPTPIVTDVTICSDEDYTWAFNSVTYNGSAGTQTVFVEGANCAADQTLNITVSPEPTPIVTDVTICSDEDYVWAFNSVTYNGSAGTQTVFVEGANCAADQTLNITVTPEPTPIVTDVTICSDEDYTWAFNSVTYNGSAGTQTVFVEGVNCAADQTLNITVSPEPTPIVTDVTICSDEDYVWAFNSVTYNGSAGTQTVFVEGVNCAADQTLNITVTPEPTPIVTDVTICSDEDYTWAFNSVTYNGSAGTQTVFVEGANCAADQTLNITVSPEPTPIVTDVTICSDEDYVWAFNSVTYNGSAGTQTVFVEGVNCAADQTLNITVTPEPTPIVTDVTICSDEDYTWAFNSVTYNGSAGTQTVFVEGANCAADQTLNITVSPEPTPIVTDVTICSDEDYVWAFNSVTYNGSAGTQTVFVEGANCAADQILNITVSPEPTPIDTDVTINSNETYLWPVNGITYDGADGDQSVLIEGINCAADQILTLTVVCITADNTTTTTSITEDETKTLTSSPNGGTWAIVSGDGTINGNIYTPDDINVNTDVTIRYTIAGTSGCSATTDDVTFTVTPSLLLGSIGDQVWYDTDGDGIRDPGEYRLEGATVTLDPGTPGNPSDDLTTTTDVNGNYLFTNLPAGNYTVTVDISTVTGGLPPGKALADLIPTFDADGVGTPNTSSLTLASGENNLDQDFAYVAPSGGTSGGNSGGVESESLGDAISKIYVGRKKNSMPTEFVKSNENLYNKSKMKSAQPYQGKGQTMLDMFPTELIAGNVANVTSPTDILDYTVADEILSVDFSINGETKGVVLGIKTSDKIYNHTKASCDRLRGAEILNIQKVQLEGYNFLMQGIKQRNDIVEYAISFAVAKNNNDTNYTIQTNWYVNNYTKFNDVYNFQVWSTKPADTQKMVKDILENLQSFIPMNQTEVQKVPETYASKIYRDKGELIVNLRSTEVGNTADISMVELYSETANNIKHRYNTLDTEIQQALRLDIADGYEYEGLIEVENEVEDAFYHADGNWGLDYDKNYTEILNYFVWNNFDRTYEDDEYSINRNVEVKATSEYDYLTVYKSLLPGTISADYSEYKYLSFTAKGSGLMELGLIKSSVENWKEQYRIMVDLSEEEQTYYVPFEYFSSTGTTAKITADDLTTITFTFLPVEANTKELDLFISDVKFTKTAVEEQTIAKIETFENNFMAYPNPSKGNVNVLLFSEVDTQATVTLFDVTGKEIFVSDVQLTTGKNEIDFNLKVKPGVLFLKVNSKQTDYGTSKIIFR
ncbi:SdrD B-like domain-containing protein [Polaribacter sp. KT25b]|uniref:SdrD B-like domain-containing protein n=1 Tax=Polaribacter sp. KT25b TaxID=1855336 RepID=UPI0015610B5B|nr:SdrD B-like domain-containing protein [Polaribacter sp. KT25b]